MADDYSDCMMDDSCGFQATKRRRKMNSEEGGHASWGVASPFATAARAPDSAHGESWIVLYLIRFRVSSDVTIISFILAD